MIVIPPATPLHHALPLATTAHATHPGLTLLLTLVSIVGLVAWVLWIWLMPAAPRDEGDPR